jgi:starch-binding outer membrane protein, SusD/RagB family
MKKLIALCLLCLACTDLQEINPSIAVPDQYFTTKETVAQNIIQAYTPLRKYIWNYWLLSEVSSDEATIMSQEGFSEEKAINFHIFDANNQTFENLWTENYMAIGSCNNAIYQLTLFPGFEAEKKLQIAEARFLRAFYHYLMLDNFGNIPIIENLNQSFQKEKQAKSEEVFAFITKEIKAIIADLPVDAEYGRINQSLAETFLVKMYLNAGVYAKKEMWNESILACDKVINSGKYRLEGNYYDNFKIQNETSKEIIFPIGFSSKIDLGWPNMNHYMLSLHYTQLPAAPWNSFATIADVYDSFSDEDIRKQAIWEGEQYSVLQWPKKSTTGLKIMNRIGRPLYFSKMVYATGNSEDAGARVVKYEPDIQASAGQAENDFVIFRYADVLLSKAEALLRLNRNSEALPLINTIRKRAGLDELKIISLEIIEKERLREFYWEGLRRQDMIRFGSFLGTYTNKSFQSEAYKTQFPIPANQLMINKNLVQNAGY